MARPAPANPQARRTLAAVLRDAGHASSHNATLLLRPLGAGCGCELEGRAPLFIGTIAVEVQRRAPCCRGLNTRLSLGSRETGGWCSALKPRAASAASQPPPARRPRRSRPQPLPGLLIPDESAEEEAAVLKYLLERSHHHHDAAGAGGGGKGGGKKKKKKKGAKRAAAKAAVLPCFGVPVKGSGTSAASAPPPGAHAAPLPPAPRLIVLRPALKRALMLAVPASAEPACLQGTPFDAGAFRALGGATLQMVNRWVGWQAGAEAPGWRETTASPPTRKHGGSSWPLINHS
jgi:hypothetical protein